MSERRLVAIGKRAKGDNAFEVLSEGTLEIMLGKKERLNLRTETGKDYQISYIGNLKDYQGAKK
jgi:hypothetical protein